MAEILPQLPPRGQTGAGSFPAQTQRFAAGLRNYFNTLGQGLFGLGTGTLPNTTSQGFQPSQRFLDAQRRLQDAQRGIQGPSPQRFGFQTRLAGQLPASTTGSAITPFVKPGLGQRVMGFLNNPFLNAAFLGPQIYEYGLKPLGDFLQSDRGQLLKDSLGRGDLNRASTALFGKPITSTDRGLVFDDASVAVTDPGRDPLRPLNDPGRETTASNFSPPQPVEPTEVLQQVQEFYKQNPSLVAPQEPVTEMPEALTIADQPKVEEPSLSAADYAAMDREAFFDPRRNNPARDAGLDMEFLYRRHLQNRASQLRRQGISVEEAESKPEFAFLADRLKKLKASERKFNSARDRGF